MIEDWARHLCALAAAWDPSAAQWHADRSPYPGAPTGGSTNPYTEIAEAFASAARAAIAGASAGSGAAASAQFAEFLRAKFGDWSALSTLGPQRLHQQRWERMAAASLDAQQAQARLGRLWSDALREAAELFAKRCADPGAASTPPPVLYDAWIDCAEEAYARMAHGEAFCSAQAAMLNAQAKLRTEMQEIAQLCCNEFDLPTRSELNSVHSAIKALRDQLAHTPGGDPTVAPPARRRAARTPKKRGSE